MRKSSTILLIFIIYVSIAFGQSIHDTTDKKFYKISKKEFIRLYDKNDKIEELIRLFYRKRSFGFSTMVAFPIASTTLISIADYNDFHNSYYEGDMITPVYTILSSLFVVATGVPLLTVSSINCIKYNRRYLYSIIRDYNNGLAIPEKINKKIIRKLSRTHDRQEFDDVYN